MSQYPDLQALFSRRAVGRAARARASVAEKLDILDKLKAAADELKGTIVLPDRRADRPTPDFSSEAFKYEDDAVQDENKHRLR